MNKRECREKLIEDKKAVAKLKFELHTTKSPEKKRETEEVIHKMEDEIKHLEKEMRHH